MGDANTRQEAVQRATAKLGAADPTIVWKGLAAAAIDASGLIEQLTEARKAIADWSLRNSELARQLAAERALCDRLADRLRNEWEDDSQVIADYDALRATERANTEKGGTDGVG